MPPSSTLQNLPLHFLLPVTTFSVFAFLSSLSPPPPLSLYETRAMKTVSLTLFKKITNFSNSSNQNPLWMIDKTKDLTCQNSHNSSWTKSVAAKSCFQDDSLEANTFFWKYLWRPQLMQLTKSSKNEVYLKTQKNIKNGTYSLGGILVSAKV